MFDLKNPDILGEENVAAVHYAEGETRCEGSSCCMTMGPEKLAF